MLRFSDYRSLMNKREAVLLQRVEIFGPLCLTQIWLALWSLVDQLSWNAFCAGGLPLGDDGRRGLCARKNVEDLWTVFPSVGSSFGSCFRRFVINFLSYKRYQPDRTSLYMYVCVTIVWKVLTKIYRFFRIWCSPVSSGGAYKWNWVKQTFG